jgi:hypothetical protein
MPRRCICPRPDRLYSSKRPPRTPCRIPFSPNGWTACPESLQRVSGTGCPSLCCRARTAPAQSPRPAATSTAGMSCGFSTPTDTSNVNPLLGPLAMNGGLTETHAFLCWSPAIEAALQAPVYPAMDQRLVPRPQGRRATSAHTSDCRAGRPSVPPVDGPPPDGGASSSGHGSGERAETAQPRA